MTNSDHMKNKANEAMDDAGKAAHGMAETLKSGARDAAAKVSDRASRSADNAKEYVADEVGSVAAALRNAAQDMRDGSPKERTFSQIADSLADVSEAIHDKDLGEMMNDVSAYARRNPLMFMGGAALLGFAASRLIKASDDSRQSEYAGSSYRRTSHDGDWQGRARQDNGSHEASAARSQAGYGTPSSPTYPAASSQKVQP